MQIATSGIKKYATKSTEMCNFFLSFAWISQNCQGIHHYIVNLWKFCACRIIGYCHHTNFATGCRKAFSAPKQNDRIAPRCSILSFGILSKIWFICINRVYWNYEKSDPKHDTSTNDLYKWSRFSITYRMIRYCILSHTRRFVLALKLFLMTGRKCCVMPIKLLDTHNISINS